MRILIKLKREQAGDTIVEVLISIAVVSLVLAGAYSATNHNSRSTRDAQDRNQAIKLVQAQVEQLNAAGGLTGGTCFKNGVPASGASCNMDSRGVSPGTSQPIYTLSIAANTPNSGIYQVKATWTNLYGKTGNVTMNYGL